MEAHNSILLTSVQSLFEGVYFRMSSGNAIYEQPAFGDIPDDFKVRSSSAALLDTTILI